MMRKLQFLSVFTLTLLFSMQTTFAQIIVEASSFDAFGGLVGLSSDSSFLQGLRTPGGAPDTSYAGAEITVNTTSVYDVVINYQHNGATSVTQPIQLAIVADRFADPLVSTVNLMGGAIVTPNIDFGYTLTYESVYLTAGAQDLVLYFPGTQGFFISSVSFVPTSRKPFDGVIEIPGLIEAENYDVGGEGLTLQASTLGNALSSGTAVPNRADNIDVGPNNAGDLYAVMNPQELAETEWMEYSVDVQTAGTYHIDLTYSSPRGVGKVTLDIDGTDSGMPEIGVVPSNGTGGWAAWQVYTAVSSGTFDITTTGEKTFKINIAGGFINLDSFDFVLDMPLGVNDFEKDATSFIVYPNASNVGIFNMNIETTWEVYSILGLKVKEGKGNQVDISNCSKGTYILKTPTASKRLLFQ